MAFDVLGRPPAETPDKDPIIRPFRDFGGLSPLFATETIQRAIDWTASVNNTDGTANVAVGQAGIFQTDSLVLKHGARLICPGPTATKFLPATGALTLGRVFALDTGPVQKLELAGFSLDMSAFPNQHALYLKAVPVLIAGVMQGGLWYAKFRNLFITGCLAGESFWLRGGGDANNAPHQFIRLESVVVVTNSVTRAALRLSGQVGQLAADRTSRFDGIDRNTAGTNIVIERTVDDAEANNGDSMPYSIYLPVTCQSRQHLTRVERGLNIDFSGAHFEEARYGVRADISAGLVTVEHAYFSNVGSDGAGGGYAVESDSGNVIAGRNFFGGAVDTHYKRTGGGQLTLTGGDEDTTGIRTVGCTLQIATAATINTGFFNSVFVNGGSATNIAHITSQLPVGAVLTLRANGGDVRFVGSADLDLGGGFDPLILPSGATVALTRNDLTGVWQIVGISGPRGAYYGAPVFVNAAASPYQIPVNTDTVRADASAGIVTLKLPDTADTPPGKRVLVKKLDSSTNVVRINGKVTAQNPDGQADNVVRLVDQTQAMEFQRNGLVGAGGWDTVASVSARSGAPGVGASLSFGTHLTSTPAGSYDGSVAITLATDATPSNVISTLMARDGNGDFAARVGNFVAVNVISATGSTAIYTGAVDGALNWGILNGAGTLKFGWYVPSGGTNLILHNYGSGHAIMQVEGSTDHVFFYDDLFARRFITNASDVSGLGILNAASHYTPYISSYFAWQGSGAKDDAIVAAYGSIALYPGNGTTAALTANADTSVSINVAGGGYGFTIGNRSSVARIFYGYFYSVAFSFLTASNTYAAIDVGGITLNNGGVGVVAGSIYYDSTTGGVSTIAKAGTNYDWSVWNPAGSLALIRVPTGTSNIGLEADLVLQSSKGLVVGSTRRLTATTTGIDVTGTLTSTGTTNLATGALVVTTTSATFAVPLTINTASGATGIDVSDSVGSTGASFTPLNAASGVFIDNRRVNSSTFFRSSASSAADRTWLSVTGAGNPTFAFGVMFSSNISVSGTTTLGATVFSGTVTSSILPTSTSTYDLGSTGNKWNNGFFGGKIELGTTIQTGAPSGGTAAAWRLGSYISGSFSVDFAHAIEVDIGGTLHKVAVLT